MKMAREILTALQVRNQTKPGKYADGGGLYLNVREGGSKSWLFVYRDPSLPRDRFGHNPRVNLSLGTSPLVSLAQARIRAAEARGLLSEGKSPKASRQEQKRQADLPTFEELAEQYVASKAGQWRSERHRQQVLSNLNEQCRSINSKTINAITAEDILAVLQAYQKKAPTAVHKLQGTMERIFDNAQALGYIDRSLRNPADIGGLLPKAPAQKPHAAMPFAELPGFMERLRALQVDVDGKVSIAPCALEFAILCGNRSGEARLAEWTEIKFEQKLWVIPARKMKANKEHTVPLSAGAMAILEKMQALRTNDLVFPGTKGAMTGKVFERLLQRMECPYVAHGFRSSLRTWLRCKTKFENEICAMAIAHSTDTKVEQAYIREGAVEKLRAVFEAWNSYLAPKTGNVIQLRA
jgi:integrase